MALVSLQNVSLKFTGSEIFSQINLQIEKNQRICLLGRNGSGKTTLMRTLAGQIRPDSGVVQTGQDVKIAYFAQEIPDNLNGTAFSIIASGLGEKGELIKQYHLAEHTSPGSESPERQQKLRDRIDQLDAWSCLDEIGKVTSRLQIDPECLYQNLSGGQKRRILLAAALVSRPDVLLLDEPTNHLDIETIAWLEEFLLKSGITILFVTHDRMLLRRLANRIIELDRGRLYDWECDYDTFLARKDELLAAEMKDWERFDKKLALEEAWIRKGIKARRTRNEGRVRALKKMRQERKQRRLHTGKAKIQANIAADSGQDVISAENISFSYENQAILKDFSLKIVRGEKIGIIGSNGCGKTTLIKILVGRLKPELGSVRHGTGLEIAYYDQLRDELDDNLTVQQNVSPHSDTVVCNGQNIHIISYLQNFLFTPEKARTKISVLSGGERNRVMLARLFATPANLLILDEPTNDLDIETLELLEELLIDFPGTVLLICHDRAFINNLVSSTLVFAPDGEIKEIIGGYDDWIDEHKAAVEAKKRAGIPVIPTQNVRKENNEESEKKLTFKEKQELASLPENIENIEAEIERLHQRFADPNFYKGGESATAAQTRLKELEASLNTMMQRWEELESRRN